MGGLLSYMAVIYLGSWLVILILGFGINGIWYIYMAYDVWYRRYGVWYLILGICYMIHGIYGI